MPLSRDGFSADAYDCDKCRPLLVSILSFFKVEPVTSTYERCGVWCVAYFIAEACGVDSVLPLPAMISVKSLTA